MLNGNSVVSRDIHYNHVNDIRKQFFSPLYFDKDLSPGGHRLMRDNLRHFSAGARVGAWITVITKTRAAPY